MAAGLGGASRFDAAGLLNSRQAGRPRGRRPKWPQAARLRASPLNNGLK
ncbi:hypothetical protein HMPREF0185_02758 [Brevundimonas diminuta 470-4]|nr:hypothetical protein HMPREF0185_02758 [Brevundimonas diminuta 470-4]